MRIRSIKPEWLDDERLVLASSDARVLSIALILLADDYGRGRANRVVLGARVFPGKIIETLGNALDTLERLSFVHLYEVDGQSYFAIRNWEKHQKVDKPGKPQVPAPPKDSSSSENPRETLDNFLGSLATDQDQDQEGKRKGPSARAGDPDGLRIRLKRGYLDRYQAATGREPAHSRVSSPHWEGICAEVERRLPGLEPALAEKRVLDAFFGCPQGRKLGFAVGQIANGIDAYCAGEPAEKSREERGDSGPRMVY
jgi:hypothetical protein